MFRTPRLPLVQPDMSPSAFLSRAAVALTVLLALVAAPATVQGASHREAPLIAMDPTADISDFFIFRSYEPGREDNVVMVMNVIPNEEPSAGPNYYGFNPDVLYKFSVDNNLDGLAGDVVFELEFQTEVRGIVRDAGLFLGFVALPPITALNGPGSEGLGISQTYTLRMRRNGQLFTLGTGLPVAPPNVGPRTMPDYDALAAQAISDLGAIRAFAGQRQDPFYIDLGGVFDTLNLRRNPPLLTTAEDADDTANPFGVDMLSGFNVHTIALEIPTAMLTKDQGSATATSQPKLGAFASTARRQVRVLQNNQRPSTAPYRPARNQGNFFQVQRLANPLINEAIIGTIDKDRWNASDPVFDGVYQDYYLNPRLALALELVYGVPADKDNRQDLVDLLLHYQPGVGRPVDLLRLDVSVPPVPLAQQRRLGPLAHDAAGNPTPDAAAWPNGRRPIDDVTDVAIRVVGGANYVGALAGDGVNVDDAALTTAFPFLATPSDGRDRIHEDG